MISDTYQYVFILSYITIDMGLDLRIKFDDGYLADVETINAYYDHMADKALNYGPDVRNQGSSPDHYRQRRLARAEERGNNKTEISEQWLSNIRDYTSIQIQDLDHSDTMDPVLYEEDIRTFIRRLRAGKEEIKQQDDPDFWEYYFELRLITLCEFALENGYGVELS